LRRRVVTQKGNYLTRDGLIKLEAELENLRIVRRRDVADRIQIAKEIGSTVDNAEYDDAKNQQAFVEGRILTLERIVTDAIIIGDDATRSDKVLLGSHVTVVNQKGDMEEYTIVGSAESDPLLGRISNESPVGKALLGKKVGGQVKVKTPSGTVTFTISGIN
jgi:transcription elongation factor GreA